MVADFSRDPRWIPPDTFTAIEEEAAITEQREADLAQLNLAAAAIRQMIEMFESKGWETFRDNVERERALQDDNLRREVRIAEWKFLRGQQTIYDWLLSVDTTMERELRKLLDKIRDIEGGER